MNNNMNQQKIESIITNLTRGKREVLDQHSLYRYICRFPYLNQISPSAVATLKNMNE